MEYFFGLALLAAIYFVAKSVQESHPSPAGNILIKEKACPPHKWEYVEILDQHGVSHGSRMTCAICKNHPGYVGRGDNEV